MTTSRGVIPLVTAIVGTALMAWSFFTGIDAALNGAGSGALPYEILLIVAGALVLASLGFAIVQLVRGQSRLLAIVTIVVGIIPIVLVVILAVRANASI
jgi:uncharacterized Tic20 family protein